MKNGIHTIVAVVGLFAALTAQAYVINDASNGANSYWGSDAHGYGDVIGDSTYNINSAEVTRVGNLLTVKISTNFAGHAGEDAWAAINGIAYGDLFLAPSWTPYGADAHHQNDSASNGTHWTYGLHLDNRWSNTGGRFELFALNGSSNLSNVLLSQDFLTCTLGTQCYYRNGQAVAVNTQSASVTDTGLSGNWAVTAGTQIMFTMDVSGTELSKYSDLAIHWGETCQNDVIEGVGKIPEPASIALLSLGLGGMGISRRRRRNKISQS